MYNSHHKQQATQNASQFDVMMIDDGMALSSLIFSSHLAD